MVSLFQLIFLVAIGIPLYIIGKLLKRNNISKGLKELPLCRGLPIIGNLLSTNKSLYVFLFNAKQKYGPIFKYMVGCREIIVLDNMDVLNKTLKEKGVIFSGRWQNIIVKTSIHNSGIMFKDKEWWAIQRSFALKVLRDFGFGKQRSTEIINTECNFLLQEIEENIGKIMSCRFLFPQYTVNIISKLVMNLRFQRSDSDFRELTKTVEILAQNRNFLVNMILMYPILEHFPRISLILLRLFGRDQKLQKIHRYIKRIIDEHKSRFDPNNEGDDVIDIFLKEQYKMKVNNVENHTFTDWQLIRVAFELFAAGYETTSTTLSWAMLMLAKHTDVQEKIYKEIIGFVGTNKQPIMNDKKHLPYTQAVMDEIFRFSSVVPLSIPHRVLENTSVDGYFIPKNSIVFPNLYACHHDEDLWIKPNQFYPEHFIRKSADGEIKYNPRDEVIPFSIGKRQCLGESLARAEYFIFFTSILQKFRLKLPDSMKNDEFNRIIEGTDGLIRAPLRSDVIFERRL